MSCPRKPTFYHAICMPFRAFPRTNDGLLLFFRLLLHSIPVIYFKNYPMVSYTACNFYQNPWLVSLFSWDFHGILCYLSIISRSMFYSIEISIRAHVSKNIYTCLCVRKILLSSPPKDLIVIKQHGGRNIGDFFCFPFLGHLIFPREKLLATKLIDSFIGMMFHAFFTIQPFLHL